MRIKYISLKPLIYFYIIWLIFLTLRFLPIIQWNDLHISSILYIASIMVIIFLSYFAGILWTKKYIKSTSCKYYKKIIVLRNFKKIFIFIFLLSIISLGLIFIKFYTQLNYFQLTASLSNVTELRYAKMHEIVQETSFIGIVGTMLSGFPIILYLITYWYKEDIPKIYFKIAVMILLIYTIAMLTSGGRNALFIVVLIIFVSNLYKNIHYKIYQKFSIKKYLKYLFIGGTVLNIFYIMFVDRASRYGYNFVDRINETAYQYHIKYNDFLVSLLDIEYLNGFVFLFLELFFYLVHSLDQFDIAFNSVPGSNFPYMGALNFYPIVQLLNKLGLNIISISQILNELPNPGNYTTLFAPLYQDFGILWSIFFIVLITFIFAYNFIIYLQKKSSINFIILTLLTLVYIVSPIYSFFALSISVPIFLAFIIFLILNSFLRIEKKSYILQT